PFPPAACFPHRHGSTEKWLSSADSSCTPALRDRPFHDRGGAGALQVSRCIGLCRHGTGISLPPPPPAPACTSSSQNTYPDYQDPGMPLQSTIRYVSGAPHLARGMAGNPPPPPSITKSPETPCRSKHRACWPPPASDWGYPQAPRTLPTGATPS